MNISYNLNYIVEYWYTLLNVFLLSYSNERISTKIISRDHAISLEDTSVYNDMHEIDFWELVLKMAVREYACVMHWFYFCGEPFFDMTLNVIWQYYFYMLHIDMLRIKERHFLICLQGGIVRLSIHYEGKSLGF